jgi:uncharacterized protein with PhoU and TrkA domain
VLFEDAPAVFDQIVLAVVRGIINEFNFKTSVIIELHHAFHELSSAAGNLGAVVQINLQTHDLRMRSAAIRQLQIKAVGHKITRATRRAKHNDSIVS